MVGSDACPIVAMVADEHPLWDWAEVCLPSDAVRPTMSTAIRYLPVSLPVTGAPEYPTTGGFGRGDHHSFGCGSVSPHRGVSRFCHRYDLPRDAP
jgi:hypothetical protein